MGYLKKCKGRDYEFDLLIIYSVVYVQKARNIWSQKEGFKLELNTSWSFLYRRRINKKNADKDWEIGPRTRPGQLMLILIQ